jgi:EAL domain-containing protein (putative c-di-GMP-specific phosphodiesterase class I)
MALTMASPNSICEAILEAGAVDIAVQPIRRIRHPSGVAGPWVEVLARPQGIGIVNLVDHCARLGRAAELDLLVFERGLRWLASHPEVELCSFNLSGQTVTNEGLDRVMLDLLDRFEILPTRICLEITETTPIMDFSRARALTTRMRDCGARVAVDDFGAGASHMRLLTPLQIDFIKIDGEFVRELPLESNRKLIRGVVAMAQELGVETVAEAVETREQAEHLFDAGVHYMQGFFDGGQPVPATLNGHRVERHLASMGHGC